jgi:hypothetical protein
MFEKFRPLFSKFQNLNLLCLIEDLKRKNVASGAWINNNYSNKLNYSTNLCPLAHGWQRYPDRGHFMQAIMEFYSVSIYDAFDFTNTWDNSYSEEKKHFLTMLESIIEERKQDADAVQQVLETTLQTA